MRKTFTVAVCVVLTVLAAVSGCRRHGRTQPATPTVAAPEPAYKEPAYEMKDYDPFEGMALAEEGSPQGTLERFLVAWKKGDMDLLLQQCRTNDRDRREFLFRHEDPSARLIDYRILRWSETGQPGVFQAEVEIVGKDTRTQIMKHGTMRPRLCPEKTPGGADRYYVDLMSAAPQWMD